MLSRNAKKRQKSGVLCSSFFKWLKWQILKSTKNDVLNLAHPLCDTMLSVHLLCWFQLSKDTSRYQCTDKLPSASWISRMSTNLLSLNQWSGTPLIPVGCQAVRSNLGSKARCLKLQNRWSAVVRGTLAMLWAKEKHLCKASEVPVSKD